jgi:hypothetical protein
MYVCMCIYDCMCRCISQVPDVLLVGGCVLLFPGVHALEADSQGFRTQHHVCFVACVCMQWSGVYGIVWWGVEDVVWSGVACVCV